MKANLGTTKIKTSRFGWDLDSSTTTSFADVYPTYSREFIPNTHGTIKISSAVRLTPMANPTFGAAYLKHYCAQVKYTDLWKPFDYMIGQSDFTGAGFSYVPSSVPNVPLSVFAHILLRMSYVSIWSVTDVMETMDDQDTGVDTISLKMIHKDDARVPENYWPADITLSTIYRAIRNDFPFIARGTAETSASGFFKALSDFRNAYGTDSSISYRSVRAANIANGTSVYPDNADYVVEIPQGSISSPSGYSAPILACFRLTPEGKRLYKTLIGLGYKAPISMDLTPAQRQEMDDDSIDSPSYRQEDVTMLPLFACYRIYFDMFAPKRYARWETTNCAQLLALITAYGHTDLVKRFGELNAANNSYGKLLLGFFRDLANMTHTHEVDYYAAAITGQIVDGSSGHYQTPEFLVNETALESRILNNLSNKDAGKSILTYIDQHPVLSWGTNTSTPIAGINNESQASLGNGNARLGGKGSAPNWTERINNYSTQNIQQVKLDFLKKLTRILAVRTATGGKVAEMIKTLYGYTPDLEDSENSFRGASTVPIQFDDIMNTTQSDEYALGDFAGKGFGAGKDKFSFGGSFHGIAIILSTVIPRTQYVDGVEGTLFNVDWTHIYNPNYDGLTLLPFGKTRFFGNRRFGWQVSQNSDAYSLHATFGNVPMYSEYRCKQQGILNGELSLLSKDNSYRGFTLDTRVLDDVQYDRTTANVRLRRTSAKNFINGVDYQYTVQPWRDSYDDIFVDKVDNLTYQPEYPDNFIVHNVIELDFRCPMLSADNTFRTKEELDDNNGDTVNIV